MNALEIENLYWKYSDTEDYALKNINLAVPENIFLGIVGPNESGKTTLVSCIKGIIPNSYTGIYKGNVRFFGKDIKDNDSRVIAENIGMVFSDPDAQFTSMSVEEEIAFGLENIGIDEAEISKRIAWVGELTAIGDLLEKPPYDLSGGQKQRVAIASVIAMKPKIIILDEPTSMLDPKSKDDVFELLAVMKKELKITVIVVEHNIEKIAELSDKVLLLNQGEIIQYEDTRKFFQDIALIQKNGLKAPESIEFLYHLYRQKGIDKEAPVKFDDIVAEIKQILGEQGVKANG